MAQNGQQNRRPPRDPARGFRRKNAQRSASVSAQNAKFRGKVNQANSVTICNTTSNKVGRMSMKELLMMDKFCVPIFQRRYCWTEVQWKTLLEDAVAVGSHRSTNESEIRADVGTKLYPQKQHSLGRLTCTNNLHTVASKLSDSKEDVAVNLTGMILPGRSCILDGQQRFTTVTILLAAIRDLLEEKTSQHLSNYKDSHAKSVELINELLFVRPDQARAWIRDDDKRVFEEGMELEFSRLIPTFCDRISYYSAILPRCDDFSCSDLMATSSTWNRPLIAKRYFLTTLRVTCPALQDLSNILAAVLNRITMLYFPIDIHQGRDDGTEDLMVIYERLALRDATFCRPTRTEEYQVMDGADMVRNLLLGSFNNQKDALNFYRDYWLPLERQTETRGMTMNELLSLFLERQREQANDTEKLNLGHTKTGPIGGEVYADFEAWLTGQEEHDNQIKDIATTEVWNSDDDGGLVRSIGKQLLQFSCS